MCTKNVVQWYSGSGYTTRHRNVTTWDTWLVHPDLKSCVHTWFKSRLDRPDNNDGCTDLEVRKILVRLYLEKQAFCVAVKSWRFRYAYIRSAHLDVEGSMWGSQDDTSKSRSPWMGQRNKIRVSIHDVYRPVHTAVCTQVYIEYTRRIYNPF